MGQEEQAQCLSALAAHAVVFDPPADVADQGCALSGAVRVARVPTALGDVELPARPAMLCAFALVFTEWVRDVAAPLAFAYSATKLAAIDSGPGFACTARYDKPGALPSEHAKGDAIDVAGFLFADKRRVMIGSEAAGGDSSGPKLLAALRKTACGYFTTVLGPGADAAHATHFHLDSGPHGQTANYRICQ